MSVMLLPVNLAGSDCYLKLERVDDAYSKWKSIIIRWGHILLTIQLTVCIFC